jgi:aspartate 1-decarboxylase
VKLRIICKSKIHHAVVTRADLHYIGSIGIDRTLMELTDIVPGEQVSVWNVTMGLESRRTRSSWRQAPARSS